MRRLVLVPHNMKSRSVKALAATLSDVLNHRVLRVRPQRVARRIPFEIRQGTDKIIQLTAFNQHEVPTVEFTLDRAVATAWAADTPVVCRTLTRSSEGKGIVVAETPQGIVAAPLYTKYFKKKKEFRVHIVDGQVIDVQEKRKKRGVDERDHRIRNTANGYVFCRDGLVEPAGLRDAALRATQALGYRLGAVDIAYNEHYEKLAVLEVNANPGLEGTTLTKYANAIATWWRNQQ